MPTISIPSSPASWSNGHTLTFAIPAGAVVTSGTWNITSTISGFTVGGYTDVFAITSDTATESGSGNGAWNYSLALTPAQVSDVNGAAGTTLTVTFAFGGPGGVSQSISACTLDLIGTFAGTIITDPMWGYGYQASTPMIARNIGTVCGGTPPISNSGPHASPASATVTFNMVNAITVTAYVLTIKYAGQSITMAVDTSPDGSTWTNQFSGSVGSDHTGSFTSEQITYNFSPNQTAQYFRFSFVEVPQAGAPSLIEIDSLIPQIPGTPLNLPVISGSTAYCGNTGEFSLTGTVRYGDIGSWATDAPRENFPMTLFVKLCCSPSPQPCAHSSGTGNIGSACNPFPGSDYCSDGQITVTHFTTDCSGNFSFNLAGSILGVAIALGTWIPNPAFNCTNPAPICYGNPDLPPYASDAYMPDTQTQTWINNCHSLLGLDAETGGTADNYGQFGSGVAASSPGGVGGLTDGSNNGYYACPGANLWVCYPCVQTTGAIWQVEAIGVSTNVVADTLQGSGVLQIADGCGEPSFQFYYVNDGKYYTVGGIYLTLTDSCGHTREYLPTPSDTGFDWRNLSNVAVTNWTQDCSPPIGTPFTGPAGGTLIVTGPFNTPPFTTVTIYPTIDTTISNLCPENCPVFGVIVQPPCLGIIPDRLQLDCYKSNLAISWVTSGAALKTSVNRGASQKVIRTYGAELWEAPYTVESTNADDIGMVFLPNESLYLTYLLSSTPKYRLNKQLGTTGAWTASASPTPSVARHSASCRGQDQATRVRALGTQSTDGILQFSQCRDNIGATWTTPVTITSFAQGPYAGLYYTGNTYVCLFSLSPSTTHGIAGGIYLSTSTDGGATWSAPSFTGQSGGQVNGICATSHGVLVAVTMSNTGAGGFYPTDVMYSRNNGVGWGGGAVFANPVPGLTKPACIASNGDNLYIAWVSGDTPQYVMSTDGGTTWY